MVKYLYFRKRRSILVTRHNGSRKAFNVETGAPLPKYRIMGCSVQRHGISLISSIKDGASYKAHGRSLYK